jgi:hypothetical protein
MIRAIRRVQEPNSGGTDSKILKKSPFSENSRGSFTQLGVSSALSRCNRSGGEQCHRNRSLSKRLLAGPSDGSSREVSRRRYGRIQEFGELGRVDDHAPLDQEDLVLFDPTARAK